LKSSKAEQKDSLELSSHSVRRTWLTEHEFSGEAFYSFVFQDELITQTFN
jgi:hypothetical protein